MITGNLRKMTVEPGDPVSYSLSLSEDVNMNGLLGKQIVLKWSGQIFCRVCGKETKKSFGEGFCYPCFIASPEASECTLRPELCRAHLGEGRDPQWEERNHNQPHVVYLASSDCVKVGVTRASQVPTRWIDQGAASAIRLAETPNRYTAGLIEVALKEFFTDKTNWQRMLKNEVDESIDLLTEKWEIFDRLPSDITKYYSENDEILDLVYPVLEYPVKVKSLSLDNSPEIIAQLMGIKGQYLLFEGGNAINIRKHTGYNVELEIR
jgi:hypothetical protein